MTTRPNHDRPVRQRQRIFNHRRISIIVRHGTQTIVRSLRRTAIARINFTQHASEHSKPDLGAHAGWFDTPKGAPTHRTHSPGQTSTGQRDEHDTTRRFHHTRPETHQNLIHPDKEQNHR